MRTIFITFFLQPQISGPVENPYDRFIRRREAFDTDVRRIFYLFMLTNLPHAPFLPSSSRFKISYRVHPTTRVLHIDIYGGQCTLFSLDEKRFSFPLCRGYDRYKKSCFQIPTEKECDDFFISSAHFSVLVFSRALLIHT